MICCVVLAGLGIFGARASRSYLALLRRDAKTSQARPFVEIPYSEHLVQVRNHEVSL